MIQSLVTQNWGDDKTNKDKSKQTVSEDLKMSENHHEIREINHKYIQHVITLERNEREMDKIAK